MRILPGNLPLKNRLLIIVMAVSISGILIMSSFLIAYDRHTAKDSMVREMSVLARIIAERSTAALSFNDPRLARDNLHALGAQPIVRLACIYNRAEKIFAVYPDRDASIEKCPPRVGKHGYEFNNNILLITEPVLLDDKLIGALFIELSLDNINTRFIELLRVIFYISLFTAFVILILANWLQKPITRPLLHLTDIARKISKAKDYSVRAQKQSDDEVGLLVDAFNDMLDQVALREQERDKAEGELLAHREHLEELVSERTEDLRKANKELEAFSYSVSHDLRSPLRSIQGFSQIIENEYSDSLNDTCKDYFKRIRASSERMAGIIDDLLNLSRLSRKEMSFQQVNLSEIATEICQNYEKNYQDRSVTFNIEEGLVAIADSHLIRIALENLFGNAWKYTAKVKNPVISFGKKVREGKTYFFVNDNGAGFEMDYVNKIFQPFQRLHKQEEFEGSGIGLAIVTRIIERHGGTIEAVGEVDNGATLYFTLGEDA